MRKLTLEFSDEEFAALEQAAADEHLSPEEMLKELATQCMEPVPADIVERKRRIMAAAGLWKDLDTPRDGQAFQEQERAEW